MRLSTWRAPWCLVKDDDINDLDDLDEEYEPYPYEGRRKAGDLYIDVDELSDGELAAYNATSRTWTMVEIASDTTLYRLHGIARSAP